MTYVQVWWIHQLATIVWRVDKLDSFTKVHDKPEFQRACFKCCIKMSVSDLSCTFDNDCEALSCAQLCLVRWCCHSHIGRGTATLHCVLPSHPLCQLECVLLDWGNPFLLIQKVDLPHTCSHGVSRSFCNTLCDTLPPLQQGQFHRSYPTIENHWTAWLLP